MNGKLVATDLTSTVESGYYYLQFVLKDDADNTLDEISCNIMLNSTYDNSDETIDPYLITSNGKYEIIVTDLAGNETRKNITINK